MIIYLSVYLGTTEAALKADFDPPFDLAEVGRRHGRARVQSPFLIKAIIRPKQTKARVEVKVI